MYLAYTDEAGDDGLPGSSPLYVQSTLYFQDLHWKYNFECLRNFRKDIHKQYGLQARIEIHTRPFLYNDKFYRGFRLNESQRLDIVQEFCEVIGQLDGKIVNVVIRKKIIRWQDYPILERALSYSLQRISMDLAQSDIFMLFVDPGREGNMRKVTRKIQRINYIPSKYSTNSRDMPIQNLIEDPISKDSQESYFIQVSDLVATVVETYMRLKTGDQGLAKAMPRKIDLNRVEDWLNAMKPAFNQKASTSNDFGYGIVCYPKP